MTTRLHRTTLLCALGLCLLTAPNTVHAQVDTDADTAGQPSDTDSNASPEGDTPAEPDTEDHPSADHSSGRVVVEALLGAGIGSRAFQRPTALGVQRLDTAVFPAIDTGLAVHVWPQDAVALDVLVRYQSSLGLKVEEPTMFAVHNQVSVRAERAEVSVAPIFRLGDAASAPSLALPLGFGLRTFWPAVHNLPTPGYSLAGPQVRAELRVAFGRAVALRVGPELLWAVSIDRELQDEGVASQAAAFGGEAQVRVSLGEILALELSYRESHAFASTTITSALFKDVERFAIARVSGTL